jgi:AraC-like DNA-binding protein
MPTALARLDTPPPGGIAWLDVSAGTSDAWGARARTGPLGLQITPLPHSRAPYFFKGARLRGTRCVWSAATVSGAELSRGPRPPGPVTDSALHLLARAECAGSVFDPAEPLSGGVIKVIDPIRELHEQFPANAHLFTLNVARPLIGVEPATLAGMIGREYELTGFQAQLLRSAVGLLGARSEDFSGAAALIGVDRYVGALAGLLLRTAVRHPSGELAQLDAIRSRTDAIIAEQATDPLLTPAAVAVQLNVSLRQLYRAFTGIESPAARIRRRRLEHAAELLASRGAAAQVDRIANQCGFVSAEYFSRAFRREFGMSPRAYRATHRDPVRMVER